MIEIDEKINILINNCKTLFKRSMFLLIGNNSAENVPILISIRNFDDKFEPNILWCFKSENGYIKRSGKNNRKFEQSCKKMNVTQSNYENFVFSSNINWCHYNDSDNILGMTFDVCVLQDFESITPNIIAKVIETVKGGGLIIFLLPKINNLSEFGGMNMDVHKKYKTFSYDTIDYRFNYRFFYSLMNNGSCLILDKDIQIIPTNFDLLMNTSTMLSSDTEKMIEKKLLKMKKKESIEYNSVASLIEMCATKDQTRAFITLIKCFNDQSNILQFKKRKLNNANFIDHIDKIRMVTAGRGRGKSALLGLSIAAAVQRGLRNICVTSPCLDNVGTLMNFVVKGLFSLGFKENEDFITQTLPLSNGKSRGISEIEILNGSVRQTVKYMAPTQNQLLDNLDLLCIDETAAIPLPTVKNLLSLRCTLVFMSSTIHGYEGTGRSLSLKLMKQIKESFNPNNNEVERFFDVNLKEPIRYSVNDDVEKWLNALLCLDCGAAVTDPTNELSNHQPSLNDCQLFQVNRDVLFSGHPKSEVLLQRIMSIYVSSHYKNTPNDLQMLCDSSSHALFCLGKATLMSDEFPIICGVIQIAFEGTIDPLVAKNSLEKGLRPSGDMTPWTLVQQFNQEDFVKLSGGRIVRIAIHPQLQRQGYGAQALKLLYNFFDRKIPSLSNGSKKCHQKSLDELVKENKAFNVLSSISQLPSVPEMGTLLVDLSDCSPSHIDYLSVSFGLTSELLRFWKKNNFIPVYLRQTVNDSTGEHSCIMIRSMSSTEAVENNDLWLNTYNNEFCRRFCNLLSGPFRNMDSILALELLQRKSKTLTMSKPDISSGDIKTFFKDCDFVRIEKYLRNLLDFHAIMDLVFGFALLNNTRKFDKMKLPKFQELVLVGMGLQHKTVEKLTQDLAVLQTPGSKPTTTSEVLGHLRECIKSMSKVMKVLLK